MTSAEVPVPPIVRWLQEHDSLPPADNAFLLTQPTWVVPATLFHVIETPQGSGTLLDLLAQRPTQLRFYITSINHPEYVFAFQKRNAYQVTPYMDNALLGQVGLQPGMPMPMSRENLALLVEEGRVLVDRSSADQSRSLDSNSMHMQAYQRRPLPAFPGGMVQLSTFEAGPPHRDFVYMDSYSFGVERTYLQPNMVPYMFEGLEVMYQLTAADFGGSRRSANLRMVFLEYRIDPRSGSSIAVFRLVDNPPGMDPLEVQTRQSSVVQAAENQKYIVVRVDQLRRLSDAVAAEAARAAAAAAEAREAARAAREAARQEARRRRPPTPISEWMAAHDTVPPASNTALFTLPPWATLVTFDGTYTRRGSTTTFLNFVSSGTVVRFYVSSGNHPGYVFAFLVRRDAYRPERGVQAVPLLVSLFFHNVIENLPTVDLAPDHLQGLIEDGEVFIDVSEEDHSKDLSSYSPSLRAYMAGPVPPLPPGGVVSLQDFRAFVPHKSYVTMRSSDQEVRWIKNLKPETVPYLFRGARVSNFLSRRDKFGPTAWLPLTFNRFVDSTTGGGQEAEFWAGHAPSRTPLLVRVPRSAMFASGQVYHVEPEDAALMESMRARDEAERQRVLQEERRREEEERLRVYREALAQARQREQEAARQAARRAQERAQGPDYVFDDTTEDTGDGDTAEPAASHGAGGDVGGATTRIVSGLGTVYEGPHTTLLRPAGASGATAAAVPETAAARAARLQQQEELELQMYMALLHEPSGVASHEEQRQFEIADYRRRLGVRGDVDGATRAVPRPGTVYEGLHDTGGAAAVDEAALRRQRALAEQQRSLDMFARRRAAGGGGAGGAGAGGAGAAGGRTPGFGGGSTLYMGGRAPRHGWRNL